MKNTPGNVKVVLEDMKRITLLTGEISTVHEQSLKKWPFILFDNIRDVEIRYDLSKSTRTDFGANSIEFFISSPLDDFEDLEKRCEILKKWAEDMFWSGIEIKLYINGILKHPIKALEIVEIKDGLKQN